VPLRRADLVGHTSEAGELLFSSEMPELAESLLDAVWSEDPRIQLVCLSGFPPGSAKLTAVLDAARRRGWRAECVPYHYATVDLREGYEAYCASMSKNFRRNLKRMEQRVAEGGGGQIDRLHGSADPTQVEEYVRRMFGIADRSWKARQGGPMAPHHRGFYRELALRFAQRGMLDLSILKIGGIDAAFLLALVEDGVYYDATISFDDAFAGLSPGTHLMLRALKVIPGSGVHTVVSHGAHEYKTRWASAFVPLNRVYLFAPGVVGGLSRILRFAAPRAWRHLRGQDRVAAS
jgi:CelD/BcsL family acetyltransferase involved in cellulose biosynthesis